MGRGTDFPIPFCTPLWHSVPPHLVLWFYIKFTGFYYFLHHYICFVLFYCGFFCLFVLLLIAMSCHCSVCVRLSHLIKDSLLTYLLTFQNADTSMDVRIAAVGAVGINRAAIRLRVPLKVISTNNKIGGIFILSSGTTTLKIFTTKIIYNMQHAMPYTDGQYP